MRSGIFLRDTFQANFSVFVIVFHYRVITSLSLSLLLSLSFNMSDCSSFVTDFPAYLTAPTPSFLVLPFLVMQHPGLKALL